jgi:precorrin-6B methylase 2
MKEIIENNSFFDIVRQVVNEGECIVEIGAGTGETTVELLKIAKEKNTKVVVIDPFDNDCPESYRYSFEVFSQRIDSYRDNLVFLRVNSLSQEAELFLTGCPIGFAFIDGLQYKNAVLSDWKICSHAKLICIDDANMESKTSQVPAALKEIEGELFIKDRHAYIW